MIKGLELIHLCRKISAIPLSRGIRTDSVLLANVRRRGIPRRNPDEPGIRHRRPLFNNDGDLGEEMENEADLEEEVDVMNIDKAYDLNESEKAKEKRRLEYVITAKKFFAPRPQPQMLTCNERECIRHLHKEDPVQWSIKTLSESFPATPDTVKKIIKAKWKITPERAKVIDGIVQKNWELLAEGKLDADPHVLEHLKRFINRREVLLEQIKNNEFYLPEVKKERIWNNGEFSSVLSKYERDVELLMKESEMGQQTKMLEDGMQNTEGDKDKGSLDLIRAKIDTEASGQSLEKKDSFLFSEMTKFYSKHTTLEDLEDRILQQADRKKKLDMVDKAILENRFGVKNSTESASPHLERNQEGERKESLEIERKHFMRCETNDEFVSDGSGRLNRMRPEEEEVEEIKFNSMGRNRRFNRIRAVEKMEEMENMGRRQRFRGNRPGEKEMELNTMFVPPDDRTVTAHETNIGELIENLRNPPQPKDETLRESKKNFEEKPKINFSDPERLKRENIYYDNEVKDIENTAFWNSGRSSKEKALAEQEKRPHRGPDWVEEDDTRPSTALLSLDPYPERIKIPKNKQKSGVIFKVKDCYYDDDGEFLYRVPGMTK